MNDDAGLARPAREDGRVRYEESLAITDSEGARRLIRGTRLLVLFMVVATFGGLVVFLLSLARTFSDAVGGVDVARSIVRDLLAEYTLPFVAVILLAVLSLGLCVLLVVGFVRQMRKAFDKQIHVRVTETSVSVDREGSGYWQSSGVEIPTDAITAVEYVDPDESSFRIELGDWRAKRFLAGRSRKWIRIARRGGPTVYLGSDRPKELAETIARGTRDDVTAEPY